MYPRKRSCLEMQRDYGSKRSIRCDREPEAEDLASGVSGQGEGGGGRGGTSGQGRQSDDLDQYYHVRRDWTETYGQPQICRYEDVTVYPKDVLPYSELVWQRTETLCVLRPLQPLTVDPSEVYCTVPGRTSLLSSTTKYNVTVAELQRRINPPECLNASLLGGILRKAKSKDGGKALRDSLRKIGIVLPAGRRKQTSVTCWTALVEEEALHMARDFTHVEFHARDIAVHLVKNQMSHSEYATRRMTLHSARSVLDELISMLSSDRTPLASSPSLPSPLPRPPLDPHLQQNLSHFSLVTHGFGCIALASSLGAARSVVDEAISLLDRPPPFTFPTDKRMT